MCSPVSSIKNYFKDTTICPYLRLSNLYYISFHRWSDYTIKTGKAQCLVKGKQLRHPTGSNSLLTDSPQWFLFLNFNNGLLTSWIFSLHDGYEVRRFQILLDRINKFDSNGTTSTKASYTGNAHQGQSLNSARSGQGPLSSTPAPKSSQGQHPSCSYHGPYLQLLPGHHSQGHGLAPMGRLLAEGPSDQHALFIRADTGKLSTSRECTCREPSLEGEAPTHDWERLRLMRPWPRICGMSRDPLGKIIELPGFGAPPFSEASILNLCFVPFWVRGEMYNSHFCNLNFLTVLLVIYVEIFMRRVDSSNKNAEIMTLVKTLTWTQQSCFCALNAKQMDELHVINLSCARPWLQSLLNLLANIDISNTFPTTKWQWSHIQKPYLIPSSHLPKPTFPFLIQFHA